MNFLKIIFGSVLLLAGCGAEKVSPNQLTTTEKNDGWELLFDGSTLNGWHIYNKGIVPSAWAAVNGELLCQTGGDYLHGDLVYDKEFENYELKFEWKISEGGNSGLFINVVEAPELPTAWASGPEYQLLDFAHQDFEVLTKKTGGIFGFPWQNTKAVMKPAGEWNQSSIHQLNGKVEFYLNGVLATTQDFTSSEWSKMIGETHFKNFPAFGKATKGRIALQDWAKGIAYRNIKIKTL